MAANKPGKAEILAAFFDGGVYSPLFTDGAVSAAFGSANGQSAYAVFEDGSAVGVQDIEKNIRVLEITLHEGRNRQIRRMCSAVGLQVVRLKRTAQGPVKLGMLQPGEYRELKKSEVSALRNAAQKSGGSAKAAPRRPGPLPTKGD